jgi:hypothetical protein
MPAATDSAGNIVEFGDGESFLREHQIRPDDLWKIIPKLLPARILDQLLRFSPVQILRNPTGLFSGDAALVEFVARAHEKVQPIAELGELFRQPTINDKWLRREQPFFVRKESFRRDRGTDRRNASERVHELDQQLQRGADQILAALR